jgi:hypothetical protein
MALEIKGVFYQALKNVFPDVITVVDPGLGRHFEGDIDADAWYDAEPYVKTVEYLVGHISAEAVAFLGNEFVEIMRERFDALGVRTIEDFAGKAPRLYHALIRGTEGEGWEIEDFRPGRIVVKETGFLPYVDFISGVIKRTLEALGALNVRVAVLNDRAEGAEVNRYLAEWLEAEADSPPT